MPVRVFEIDAAPAPVTVDFVRVLARRIGPIGLAALANPGEAVVEFVIADQEGIVLAGNRAFLSMKSSDTPFANVATRKCENGWAGGRPRTSQRNCAERALSLHQTMVWLSWAMVGVPKVAPAG